MRTYQAAGRPGIGEYLTATGNGGMGATAIERAHAMPMMRIDRPRGGFFRTAANVSPAIGALGQAAEAVDEGRNGNAGAAAAIVAVAVMGLAIRGVAGYFVGKAVAPSEDKETAYAWGGVLASVFLGTIGLGIEAGVALSQRD